MDDPDKSGHDRHIALEARDWIVRLGSGAASQSDLRRFKAWRDASPRHRQAFESERRFWQQLQALDGSQAAVSRVSTVSRPGKLGRRSFLVGSGAVAIGALGAVALPPLEKWLRADFRTGVGEQAKFALPDGSVAFLNTDSAISIDFRPQLRLVHLLDGEAEFAVRHDAPSRFRVAAQGGNSDALGTAFSVKLVQGLATVTALEGIIRVAAPAEPRDLDDTAGTAVDLAAGDQTSYAAGQPPAPPVSVDTASELAWRTGRVIFEARPFGRAIAELGRYLPERIVLAPGVNAALPVSAVFSTRQAMAAVQALARTQGLRVRRIPGVAILIS